MARTCEKNWRFHSASHTRIVEAITHIIGEILQEYGLPALLILSFTESFIQPIPAAILLGIFQDFFDLPLLWVTALVFVSNVAGAFVGYFLGKWLGNPILEKLFGIKKIQQAEIYFEKWGEWAVFFAAITPFPFKVATVFSGALELSLWKFALAVVIGRTIHFAIFLGAFDMIRGLF